ALETQAIGEALAQGGGPARFKRLGQAAEDYTRAAETGDPALIVMADGAFHRELCRASGNAPLLALWQSLSRQLSVVWGLGRQNRDPAPAGREHSALVQALLANDRHGAADALADHVNWHQRFDFEAVLLERRGATVA
ncbi:MAG: GntR family transcriptional regulator, partial [Acetobacteraceae bacterium]|nr:GntR family transcriptional regulator [Acetobacteraceae bacterium]